MPWEGGREGHRCAVSIVSLLSPLALVGTRPLFVAPGATRAPTAAAAAATATAIIVIAISTAAAAATATNSTCTAARATVASAATRLPLRTLLRSYKGY